MEKMKNRTPFYLGWLLYPAGCDLIYVSKLVEAENRT